MDAAMVDRLSDGEGWALLRSLPPYDERASLTLQGRLREAGYDAELVAAAMTQSRLRSRGVEKFGEFAAGMLFTADGLEQSTRLAIAARHAHRYAAAGVRDVYDLGCGLGADAMAFAGLDLTVHAVDADAATARVAAVNLRHWPSARVTHALAEDVVLPQGEGRRHLGLWLDPARRVSGVADVRGRTKRVFSLDAISPSWSQVLAFADDVPATGAKLSPSFPHGSVPRGAEAQWTSWYGEVLECAVWWGPLVTTAGRTAAMCTETSTTVVTEADAADGARSPALGSVHEVSEWLYEPDRAVIRAGLTGALVAAVDGAELAPGVGYVTSAGSRDLPWARRFRVVEAMPLSTKRLARWLRDHGHDRVTVKKRGVTVDADVLRRLLKMTGRGRGGSEATLVLTRIGGSQVALVVTPA
ncbi:class I SAM-dependent methyltransferase [Terrabacter sp. MAHUQ-38]|uniref:THUMP-like domain-containing protein n=1 Tax=unclassified Terrabacter TaxID=2630222 RepID=UPI00165D5168|nr:class I SAM-dependent methyltransferase [Terrabacter sp. MAHUQ-38]MBC9822017.1 class I SAM-dependent methyltransferase [Terrabacter sp. MAHUQ-38]